MLNTVVIAGRLVADPKETKAGEKTIHSFALAVENGKEGAYFFECKTFDNKAIAYCHKGDRIALTGSLSQRKYTAKDGTSRNAIEVVVHNIDFLNVNSNKEVENVSESK